MYADSILLQSILTRPVCLLGVGASICGETAPIINTAEFDSELAHPLLA